LSWTRRAQATSPSSWTPTTSVYSMKARPAPRTARPIRRRDPPPASTSAAVPLAGTKELAVGERREGSERLGQPGPRASEEMAKRASVPVHQFAQEDVAEVDGQREEDRTAMPPVVAHAALAP